MKHPKLGLIGRVDHRGIGIQTGEFWRHMGKPRTLAVLIDDGFPCDEGRFGYDDVLYAKTNLSAKLNERVLDEAVCRDFLKGLDVVFAVETTYDWEFVNWAAEMGVKVWVQGNPEMLAHDRPIPGRSQETRRFPHPRWCWPTTWQIDRMPPGPLLPVPCVDREPVGAPTDTQELRVLHVAGKFAAGDRNGTAELIESLRSLQEHVHVTIYTQERRLPIELRRRGNVSVEVITGGIEDRWEMYPNHHVLVLPRKYGGLCLSALEAMSCGLTVMMTNQSPNETWPGPRIACTRGRNIYTPAGRVTTMESHPLKIAQAIDRLARDRDGLHDEMTIAHEWARANNWDALRPLYWKVLGS